MQQWIGLHLIPSFMYTFVFCICCYLIFYVFKKSFNVYIYLMCIYLSLYSFIILLEII